MPEVRVDPHYRTHLEAGRLLLDQACNFALLPKRWCKQSGLPASVTSVPVRDSGKHWGRASRILLHVPLRQRAGVRMTTSTPVVSARYLV